MGVESGGRGDASPQSKNRLTCQTATQKTATEKQRPQNSDSLTIATVSSATAKTATHTLERLIKTATGSTATMKNSDTAERKRAEIVTVNILGVYLHCHICINAYLHFCIHAFCDNVLAVIFVCFDLLTFKVSNRLVS